MGVFEVVILEVEACSPAENSDFLEVVKLKNRNYKLIGRRGAFRQNDTVVLFSVDSIVLDWILNDLNLKLDKNRVRTIKLRGNLSQGLICKIDELSNPQIVKQLQAKSIGADVAELLGVTKYEPPPTYSYKGNLTTLPKHVEKYDIENADKLPDVVNKFEHVIITEKLEGSHWWATLDIPSGEFTIGQRNFTIEPFADEQHVWIETFYKQGLDKSMLDLVPKVQTYQYEQGETDAQKLTIRGKMIGDGIQKNIYNLKGVSVYLFEIEIDGLELLPATEVQWLNELVEANPLAKRVPVIYEGQFSDWEYKDDLNAGATYPSMLNPETLAEGIVIKPASYVQAQVLKIHSPDYLIAYNTRD